MNVPATGASSFWVPLPMTSAPAEQASSWSSSRESCSSQEERDLSSRPTRKTRSGLLREVSMSAFKSDYLFSIKDYHSCPENRSAIWGLFWAAKQLENRGARLIYWAVHR